MEIISSTQNKFVKEAKSLHDKKFRDSTGLFLVEGVNILKDLDAAANVKYIFCDENSADIFQNKIFSDAFESAQVFYCAERIIGYISGTVSPQGIVAVCKKPKETFKPPSGNAILLDGVSDPGNLGTIVRTAAAADFKDIYLLDCVDIYSPKVVRATMGTLFKVRFCEVDKPKAVELVKSTNSAALDMNGEEITRADIKYPVLLIAGSEAHGVSEDLKKNVKQTLSITMKNGVESLNVAVASAVAMYKFYQEI